MRWRLGKSDYRSNNAERQNNGNLSARCSNDKNLIIIFARKNLLHPFRTTLSNIGEALANPCMYYLDCKNIFHTVQISLQALASRDLIMDYRRFYLKRLETRDTDLFNQALRTLCSYIESALCVQESLCITGLDSIVTNRLIKNVELNNRKRSDWQSERSVSKSSTVSKFLHNLNHNNTQLQDLTRIQVELLDKNAFPLLAELILGCLKLCTNKKKPYDGKDIVSLVKKSKVLRDIEIHTTFLKTIWSFQRNGPAI